MRSVAGINSREYGMCRLRSILTLFVLALCCASRASVAGGTPEQKAAYVASPYKLVFELGDSTMQQLKLVYVNEQSDGFVNEDVDLSEDQAEEEEELEGLHYVEDESGIDPFDDSTLSEHVPDDIDWFF